MKIFKNINHTTLKNIYTSKKFILGTIIIVSVLLIFIFIRNIFTSEEQRISSLFERESTRIESTILEKLDSTAEVADIIGEKIIKYPNNSRYINNILRKYRSIPEISKYFTWTMFSWSDDKYRITVDADYGIVKPIDVTYSDVILETKTNPNKLHLGSPVSGATSKKWIIPAAIGFVDKNNNYLGALSIGFELEALANSLRRVIHDKNIEFKLVSKKKFQVLQADIFHSISFYDNSHLVEKEVADIIDSLNNQKENSLFQELHLLSSSDSVYVKPFYNSSYYLVLKYKNLAAKESLKKHLLDKSFEIIAIFCILILICVLLVAYNREKRQQNKLSSLHEIATKANESKDKILSLITHDIKNYIFGIHGLASMSLEHKTKEEISTNEDLQTMETIMEHSRELTFFVEDLLDINQKNPEDFKTKKFEECEVKSLIDRILLMNTHFARQNKILLKADIENNLPKINCDVRRMKQILANILNNAIKYSFEGGKVRVLARYLSSENKIYIEIADEGSGMTKKEIDKYLSGNTEIYINDSIKEKSNSHIIGIPIILDLIKMHDGVIEVNSIKNKGTIVKLYFNAVKNTKSNSIINNNEFSGYSALLVEDNPVNIKVTSRLLVQSGFDIYVAENGEEALKILDEKQVDIILMDGEMPVMNGYEATRKIREGSVFKNFKNFKNIPIVALMSSSDEETLKKTFDSGMNDHVEKSASRTNLIEAIRKYL